ncbi:MAG: choice-of-anchor D domain-containing protein [Candidatus Kapabacteria bacterium]|nr:choice-of-anchor D domain-containing protein [Candidatus Kapabacteria bacterium]
MKHVLLFLLFICAVQITNAQQFTVSGNNFDTTLCGTKKCQKVFFKNTTANPLIMESIAVLGPAFTLEDATYVPPHTVNAGDSIGFTFCYTAATAGKTDSEEIKIQITGVATQQLVTLKGKTVAPRLTVGQTSVDFGSIIVGTSKLITVVVTNQGDATLTIPNATGVNPPFFFTRGAGIVLQPGQSDTLNFLYLPTTEGTQNGTAVYSGLRCQNDVSITLRGTAIKTPQPTIGGVLRINPTIVDFDTAMCGQQKCVSVEFRNIGSDNVIIRSIENAPATPFSGTIPTSTIAANATSTFQLCYQPTVVPGADNQKVTLRADTRQSLSVGMLYDISGSMTGPISSSDATIRLTAAKDAGKIFIGQLINDAQRNVIDRAQIMSFSSGMTSFTVRDAFTTNRTSSTTAITNLVAGGGTCLYGSIIQAVNNIKSEPNPVLVLLSDGADDRSSCASTTLQNALDAIAANKIRVFVVGIVDPNDALATTLRTIAQAGNGTAAFAVTQQELTNAFLQIAQQLSQNILVEFELKGTSVAPLLTINPASVEFDSVKVGDTKCVQVSVRNAGTAPQAFSPALFAGQDPQFTIRNLPVATLQPNAPATTFDVCFTPTSLRNKSTIVNFDYNKCRQQITFNTHGVGYDSVVIVMDTSMINAKNGDTVRVPVKLRSTIPASYAVDSLQITVEYNPTVLYAVGTQTNNTITATLPQTNTLTTFGVAKGNTAFSYRGGTLTNATNDARLTTMNFSVLRGNALFSDIRISGARFADGNPKVGIVQPAKISLDTVCYLPQRLVDPSERVGGVSLTKVVMQRNGEQAGVSFTQEQDAQIQITMFDQLGREIVRTERTFYTKGEHTQAIQLQGIQQGMYFVRIEANGSVDSTVLNFIP